MRVGPRFTLSLMVPIVALLALYGYIDQRFSRTRHRAELAREGRAMAHVLRLVLEDYLRDRQFEDVRELIDQISDYERVLGVRLFRSGGDLVYQSPALEPHPFLARTALEQAFRERRVVETRRGVGDEDAMTFVVPLASPASPSTRQFR